jgi:hypothetical protein
MPIGRSMRISCQKSGARRYATGKRACNSRFSAAKELAETGALIVRSWGVGADYSDIE